MKATIHKSDGTRIEADGTPEEIARLMQPAPTPYVPVTIAPQTCTCWAGLCPLHTMRGVSPWPPFIIGEPWCLGSVTGNKTGAWAHSNAAACAPNLGAVWIGTIPAYM